MNVYSSHIDNSTKREKDYGADKPVCNLFAEERNDKVYDKGIQSEALIFSKVSKAPILAIEADGFMYHKEGTEQYQRDRLKNSILDKFGLPLLRLSTLGSEERDVIRTAIAKRLETIS